MKTLMTLAAAASLATAALFLSKPAEARHEFCYSFPESMLCDGFYDGGDPFFDDDFFYERRIIRRQPQRRKRPVAKARSCRSAAEWLARTYNYRRVEGTDCDGPTYVYIATRGRSNFSVVVDGRRLRVISTKRLRR